MPTNEPSNTAVVNASGQKNSSISQGFFSRLASKFKSNTKPSADPLEGYQPAIAKYNALHSNAKVQDQRFRIVIPEDFINLSKTGIASLLPFSNNIFFPYTPSVSVDYTSNYTALNPTHSNYTQYFYKNSQVSEISLSCKFTVDNLDDGQAVLSTMHISRALTKMRFGNDPLAGSPPPVCTLMGYGDFQFDNTPVVVKSFSMEYPDNVDYYIVDLSDFGFGVTSIPVMSTFKYTLLPVYSRNQILNSSVKGYLSTQKLDGYL